MAYNWENALEKCEFLVALYIRDASFEALSPDRFRYYLEDIAIGICGYASLDDINHTWEMFMDGKITVTYAVKYLTGEINEKNIH